MPKAIFKNFKSASRAFTAIQRVAIIDEPDDMVRRRSVLQ